MNAMGVRKYFVLDTNVLLHNAESLTSFDDNYVILPMTVIEELDSFKRHNDELGRSARHVIRQIDQLRSQGSLKDGVTMANSGILQIIVELKEMPGICIDMSVPDNRILAVAHALHQEGKKVIFVSKDINARLKADALGIDVMDFEKQKCNFDELYTGWTEVQVATEMVDRFHEGKSLETEGFDFLLNEFVLLQDAANPKHSGMGRAVGPNSLIHLNATSESVWNVHSRSKEQRMALELLMDPKISLVTLIGQGGRIFGSILPERSWSGWNKCMVARLRCVCWIDASVASPPISRWFPTRVRSNAALSKCHHFLALGYGIQTARTAARRWKPGCVEKRSKHCAGKAFGLTCMIALCCFRHLCVSRNTQRNSPAGGYAIMNGTSKPGGLTFWLAPRPWKWAWILAA